MAAQVAKQYRHGKVFLVGDAVNGRSNGATKRRVMEPVKTLQNTIK